MPLGDSSNSKYIAIDLKMVIVHVIPIPISLYLNHDATY